MDENNSNKLDTAINEHLNKFYHWLQRFHQLPTYTDQARELHIDNDEYLQAVKEGNHQQLVNDALEEQIRNGMAIAKAGFYTKTFQDVNDPILDEIKNYSEDLFGLVGPQATDPEIIKDMLESLSLEVPEDIKSKNLYARVILSREIRGIMNIALRKYAEQIKKTNAPPVNSPAPSTATATNEPSTVKTDILSPGSPTTSDTVDWDFNNISSPFNSPVPPSPPYNPTNKELFPSPDEKPVTVEDLLEDHPEIKHSDDGKEEVVVEEEVKSTENESIPDKPLNIDKSKKPGDLSIFEYMEDFSTLTKNPAISKPTFDFFLSLQTILRNSQNKIQYFDNVVKELKNYKQKNGNNNWDSVMNALKTNETTASEENLDYFRNNYEAKLIQHNWITEYNVHKKHDQLDLKKYYKQFTTWFNVNYSKYLMPLYVAARNGKIKKYDATVKTILKDLPLKLKSSTLSPVLKGSIIENPRFKNAVVDYVEHRAVLDLITGKNLLDQDLGEYNKIQQWSEARKYQTEEVINQHKLNKAFDKFTGHFKPKS